MIMKFVTENIGSIIVLLVLLISVAAAVAVIVKRRKSGGSACGCDCAFCEKECEQKHKR